MALSRINFATVNWSKNCSSFAPVARSFYDPQYDFIVPEELRAFFLNADALPQTTLSNITDGQIYDWFKEYKSQPARLQEFRQCAIDAPIEHCRRDLCMVITWPGNPDVSGIGILYSNHIQHISTGIIWAWALYHWNRKNRIDGYEPFYKDKHFKFFTRTINAIRACSTIYLDSAALFAFSVAVAALYITFYKDSGSTNAEIQLARLSSMFAYMVVEFLLAVTWKSRRKKLRIILLMLLTALNLAIVIGGHFNISEDSPWEAVCGQHLKHIGVAPIFIWLGFLALPVCGAFVALFELYPIYMKKGFVRRHIDIFASIYITYIWAVMTGLVIIYQQFRLQLIAMAGMSNQESSWSFGQILALFTWAPVFIDFFYTMIFGIKTGLEGRLLQPWKVHLPERERGPQSVPLSEGLTDIDS